MAITKRRMYIGDYYDEALSSKRSYGKTSLFSTGNSALDTYIGGGYGRENGYEIVVLYGPTGIGKSTVGLNMISSAITDGRKVGLLVLEDSMPDVSNRLEQILTLEQYQKMNVQQNVLCLPDEALEKSWTLADLLEYIEEWFTYDKADVIFLDHLQFAYENAESIKGENEYIAQRVFMQKLNQLIKKLNKTIILVSHVNKTNGAKGMDKIVGSGSIVQAATKVIEIGEGDVVDSINFTLRKSRFTKRPSFHYCMKMVDGKLSNAV